MALRNPHFEVRPSLVTGDTAEVYLHRTQRVLRNEGVNPAVVMEFSTTQSGVLCGTSEVKAVLDNVTSEGNREVWAVQEGERVETGEVCLQVRAPYSSFGLYETAISGILAQSTGWATAANELVRAAGSIPVISVGAHNVHPSVAGVMDYSAVIGGCESGSTVLGSRLANTQPIATVSGALIHIMGGPTNALVGFDRSVAPDVPRVAYVDPRYDPIEQTVEVARLMEGRLSGIRLARVPGAKPIPSETIRAIRIRLDQMGCANVAIILSGEMSPEGIRQRIIDGAPIGMFHDSGYIAAASPVPFRANLREINDRPVPQEEDPGPPNPRLIRIL
jgi:nicotinate phosphoribosyltransferase